MLNEIDATARPGAQGPIEEADYAPRPPLFQHTGEALELGDNVVTRSELDLATEFLGEHQVVEALLRGERVLITYSILAMPDGQTRAMFTGHTEQDEELRFAHIMLLDTIRRQLDRVDGEGETARMLFIIAATPAEVTTTTGEDGRMAETVDYPSMREQPGPDPELPDDGVPHEEEGGVGAPDEDDDDDE